ncbi:MAG: DUF3343 domain-containing protein [Anaerolineae bacterium]|nr:DUF3343 domain-containing protein [Anaerolineae bacterium]
MTAGKYTVILLYATSHAIRAEKLLKQASIPPKMIPVPRHLSSSCGVCIRIARADREAAQQVLQQAGMEIEGLYDISPRAAGKPGRQA